MPIRAWQIWNEPNLTRYWTSQPFAKPYVKLLRASRRALRAADPGSRTILAGLPNESWIALRKIYKAGGRGAFDAVALHPYTGRPRNVIKLIEFARREMRRFHDGRKPVWLTELSWPASQGKTGGAPGFVTTERGQASRLKLALSLLAKARKRLKIQRVVWYTWLSREGSRNSFDWSGLRRAARRPAASRPARSACSGSAAKRLAALSSGVHLARGRGPSVNGAARARPAARRRARSSAEPSTSRRSPPRTPRPPARASRAAPPAVSGSAVASAAITGVPQAIASSTGRPKPS